MSDGLGYTAGSGATIATDDLGGIHYQRVKNCYGDDGFAIDVSTANPMPVLLYNASMAVTGALTDTQLRASAVSVTGPLTDTQLRASAVPVSVSSMPTTTVQDGGGSITVDAPVANPVYVRLSDGASAISTLPVSGPLTDTQLRASAVPVSGTFWQATQPVSIAAAVSTTAPTLTKGTQGANGWSVQNLRDAGRSCLMMTAEFTFAQTAETLLTLTLSVDGAATSTFSSRTITNGKKFRLQSISGTIESLGSGTAPQRAYLRLRRNNAGATTASSALQGVWGFVNATAVVKSGFSMDYEIPEALEMNGDGTATFGFTLETPDWVTTTATGRGKFTIIGYEY